MKGVGQRGCKEKKMALTWGSDKNGSSVYHAKRLGIYPQEQRETLK